MSQINPISAASPFTQRASAPVFRTEPFYIPPELRANSPSMPQGGETADEATALEALIADRLAETIASLQALDTLSANDRHIHLFNAIMQSRDQFPSQAFHIKTDLPGGASIETEIAAIGTGTSSPAQSVPVISTSRLFTA